MRILILLDAFPPYHMCESAILAYHACRGLVRAGVDCSVLVVNAGMTEPRDEADWLDCTDYSKLSDLRSPWEEVDDIPFHRVGLPTRVRCPLADVFDPRVYRAVRAELRWLKPHLVHIHSITGATLAPYVACRVAGVPVVNTLYDSWLLCPNPMLYRRDAAPCTPAQDPGRYESCYGSRGFWGDIPHREAVLRALTSNVRVFVCSSQALAHRHVEAGYASERFRVIRPGLGRVGTARAGREPMLAKSSHPGVSGVVGSAWRYRAAIFAGGGDHRYGAEVLIRALPMMLRHIERLRVIVVGGGDERLLAEFRKYAPVVEVLGPVSCAERRELLAAADLALVPSVWHENSPLIIHESFQVGTPVVGAGIGAIPELIRDGSTGYICPADNAAALAERTILHFAGLACQRRRMRARCVQEARSRLSLDRHLQDTLQLYREVAGT